MNGWIQTMTVLHKIVRHPTKILIKTAFQNSTKTYPLAETEPNDIVQNFANWFTYYRKREFVAKALITHAIANNSSARVGTCHDTVKIHIYPGIGVKPLNQSVLSGNKHVLLRCDRCNELFRTLHPLRQSYEKAGEYFRCNANNIFNTSASVSRANGLPLCSTAPAGSCQVSSSFLLTDGFDDNTCKPNYCDF